MATTGTYLKIVSGTSSTTRLNLDQINKATLISANDPMPLTLEIQQTSGCTKITGALAQTVWNWIEADKAAVATVTG